MPASFTVWCIGSIQKGLLNDGMSCKERPTTSSHKPSGHITVGRTQAEAHISLPLPRPGDS